MKKIFLALALVVANNTGVFAQMVTFNYTGSVQTYTVPTCVFQLDITAAGAEGGGTSGSGGDGALVTGTIAVTPGQVLQIYVGGAGTLTSGGFNGGGTGWPGFVGSGGGGGASDVRIMPYTLFDRVIVAAGGGGTGGGDQYAMGGSGGDPDGSAGDNAFGTGGGGGTSTGGGAGGSLWTGGSCGSGGNGSPGTFGNGGAGGPDVCWGRAPGGGGGGGWYGGGGGGSDDINITSSLGGGGGGGGSSLIPGGGTATMGANTGNGYIIINPIGGGSPLSVTPAAPVICNGGSIALTVSGGTGTGYSWSPGSLTGSTVTVSPTTTTTYTVTETGSACPSTTTVTVTVNPLPVATATPATTTICTGTAPSIALSSSIPGTTYAWTVSQTGVTGGSSGTGATIAQVLTSSAPPGGTATYTITPTVTSTGCVGAPITATVTVEQPVISGISVTDALCFGSSDGTITINAVGVTQYSIDNGTTFQSSNSFTGLPSATYPIVVISANGCQTTTTATVNQPTAISVPMSFTDETCAGSCDGVAGTAPSGGTSPYSYLWSTGGTSPFIGSLCSGTYNVTVTDAHGCTASGVTTVNGPVVVSISSISATPTQCNGGTDGQIVINSSGGATMFSIDGGATFQASNTFTGLPAGTYICVAADAGGCSATMVGSINQPSMLVVAPAPGVTICQGQSANIFATVSGATPPYTMTWTDPGGATVGTTSSTNVTPTTTGSNMYTLTVTDNNGCGPVTGTVTVTLRPPLVVVASPDQSICPNTSATINTVSATGGDGTYTYTWTNSANSTTLFGSSQTVTPTVSPTSYIIKLTDGCGTPAVTDTVVIDWYPLPAVSYLADVVAGCTPVVVNFMNTTPAGATATYAWDFGDGGTSTLQNPTHAFVGGGSYTISLDMVTSDGCPIDTVIVNQITVYDYPVPQFVWNPNPTDVFNTEITFTNMTTGGFTYDWDFGGLGVSQVTNPAFTFPVDSGGVYNVCLSTVSSDGCPASICHEVVVDDVFLIYVPNTFTPDGDGINDVFMPVLQGYNPKTYELYIFDRWGEVVFKSTDITQGWDGMYKSIKAKEDVYVWKIRVKRSTDQKKYEYFGNVNLLR